MSFKVLDPYDPSGSILAYLEQHGGIIRDAIIVLKSRKISNLYIDARILNAQDATTGTYIHQDFLTDIGELIAEWARKFDVDLLVGIVTTGATLVKFAAEALGVDPCYINPHDEDPVPDADVAGRRVLIVDDTTTTGGSLFDAVAVCEGLGAELVGALTLVRRDPRKVKEFELGLDPEKGQVFISLLDIDFKIKVEDFSEDGELFNSGLPIRLDVGYAATDNWPEKYPNLIYMGQPNKKH